MATYYNNNNSNSSSCNNNNNNNNHSKIEDGAGGSGAGLQTLILMNPTTPYPHPQHLGSPFLNSDADQQQQQQQQQQHHQQNNSNNNNLVFLNSVATTLNPRAFSHAPFHPQQQQLLGIPLDHPRRPSHHEISALHHHALTPRVHYNNNIMYPGPMEGARDLKNGQQGGLSLTLSAPPTEARVSGGSTSSPEVSNKVNHAVLGSRYLKAAQELLDEVVSVGREVVRTKLAGESSGAFGEGGSGAGESGGKRGGVGEITTAERQEIQMRKAKLVAMLDEVDQRYRQYHRQMQIVISWFEQETGIGSAKTYTALALQTISKQFRCLKDAISSQIRASSKSLGEEDSIGGSKNEGSRLKFVDHQIRQQKALQQLGMMQPNAWRPQRGLPERAVSVLRAWLFEHFLHPYPKDSDKIMLAKQTGLNRSQVSNWFINARVRLWKPMVEEMYMEEVKEQEHNGSDNKTAKSENNDEDSASKTNTLQEKTPATENQSMNFKSAIDMPTSQNSPSVISTSPSPTGVTIRNPPGFTLINSPDMGTIAQASPKKQRNTEFLQPPNNYLYNEQISMKFGDERHNRENLTLMGSPMNFIGGFGAYPIGEIGRFGAEQFPTTYSGNGVALTLGLPHSENLSLPGAHQSFLQNQNIQMGRRYEIGEPDEFAAINASNPSHSSVAYESINMQNRKRFAAQLLPDFVT